MKKYIPKELSMREQIIANVERMKTHYNNMIEAYEELPELKPVRKQIIEDALLVIGITMDGVINEIIDEGGRIK
jgi:uracil phosphoribosyltransferase